MVKDTHTTRLNQSERKRKGREGESVVCLFECGDDKKNISFIQWHCDVLLGLDSDLDLDLDSDWFEVSFGMKRK